LAEAKDLKSKTTSTPAKKHVMLGIALLVRTRCVWENIVTPRARLGLKSRERLSTFTCICSNRRKLRVEKLKQGQTIIGATWGPSLGHRQGL